MNFLTAQWQNLIMANFAISPAVLEKYLPAGTELDDFQGRTFVSLVGFLFAGTRIFGWPIPGMGTFEEINLRFYVVRRKGVERQRGVVFLSETVPYKPVAWLANKLYREHYSAVPTTHSWEDNGTIQQISYSWLPGKKGGRKADKAWDYLRVQAGSVPEPMQEGSLEEFIFEHYYGYTSLSPGTSEEYKVEHPRWLTYPVQDYSIQCDFGALSGADFRFLSGEKPVSVILAAGSGIAVKWERERFAG